MRGSLSRSVFLDGVRMTAGWFWLMLFLSPLVGAGATLLLTMWMGIHNMMSIWAIGVNITVVILLVVTWCWMKYQRLCTRDLHPALLILLIGMLQLPFQDGMISFPVIDEELTDETVRNLTDSLQHYKACPTTILINCGILVTAAVALLWLGLAVLDALEKIRIRTLILPSNRETMREIVDDTKLRRN